MEQNSVTRDLSTDVQSLYSQEIRRIEDQTFLVCLIAGIGTTLLASIPVGIGTGLFFKTQPLYCRVVLGSVMGLGELCIGGPIALVLGGCVGLGIATIRTKHLVNEKSAVDKNNALQQLMKRPELLLNNLYSTSSKGLVKKLTHDQLTQLNIALPGKKGAKDHERLGALLDSYPPSCPHKAAAPNAIQEVRDATTPRCKGNLQLLARQSQILKKKLQDLSHLLHG